MRLELNGAPNAPVLASTITSALIAHSNELYGSLPGIEEVIANIAQQLLEAAGRQTREYQIVISLLDDGDYHFGVKALRYIAERPRCRNWGGPGDYWHEVYAFGGSSFKHLITGSL